MFCSHDFSSCSLQMLVTVKRPIGYQFYYFGVLDIISLTFSKAHSIISSFYFVKLVVQVHCFFVSFVLTQLSTFIILSQLQLFV